MNEEHKGWALNLEAAGQTGDTGPDGAKVGCGGLLFEGWLG